MDNKLFDFAIKRKMKPRAKMTRNNDDDSGADLHTIGYSRVIEGKVQEPVWFDNDNNSVNVKPGERILLKTGVSFKLPEKRPNVIWNHLGEIEGITGYYVMEAQVRPRSGLSLKSDTNVKFGTVDNPYTGDVGVIFQNAGNEDYVVHDLDRIAQLVFQEVYIPVKGVGIIDVEELEETARGGDGFGASGIKGGK